MVVPPGLTIGLYHSQQEQAPWVEAEGFTQRHGGDMGAPRGQGFNWWEAPINPGEIFDYTMLPPGLVVGLRHSANIPIPIRINGVDVLEVIAGAKGAPDGLVARNGGDLGADKGVGFYWFETMGSRFNPPNLHRELERLQLPQHTVVALRHSATMRLIACPYWLAPESDPITTIVLDPVGQKWTLNYGNYALSWVNGGDRGAPSGVGFYYFRLLRKG